MSGMVYLGSDDPDFGWEFRAEDFVYARLREEMDAATALHEGSARDAAVARVESLRLAVVQHSCYVTNDGYSQARCFTCDAACGFPCSTMRYFTRMWRHHPEYKPGWNTELDRDSGPSDWQQDMLRVAARGGFRNDFLAERAQGQTSPSKGDRVT
ncbi:hypothetical protein [Streptomyces sp. NRRL F-5135]|uniref:hypothetical protein n=1 Tax=Streptomyces sp. NRRL F-5135 TaxID=1463858 RepID=UPI0004CB6879|nr:hypothetical protein [Streptomyces sp. NRRL F-5135]